MNLQTGTLVPDMRHASFGDPSLGLIDLDLFPSLVQASHIVSQELSINDALPGLNRHEPTALLIDINNFYKRADTYGFRIDYEKLKAIFESRCKLQYCAAFSAIDRHNPKDLDWQRRMESYGYQMITKDLKVFRDEDGEILNAKGNMDVEIAMTAAYLPADFKHVIIATCDGDFEEMVNTLRDKRDCTVSVLGIKGDDWIGMSLALAQSADHFYNLMDIREHIEFRGFTQ